MTKKLNTTWRTIIIPFSEVSNSKDYEKLYNFIQDMSEKQQEMLNNRRAWERLRKSPEITSRGNFRNQVLEELGKPYKHWDTPGKKAKYYRIMIERMRQLCLSVNERIEVAGVCAQYDYNLSRLADIRKALTDKGMFVSMWTIRNICASKGKAGFPEKIGFIYDGTAEDADISGVTHSNGNVSYYLDVYGEKINFTVKIPSHVRENTTGKWARPVAQIKNGGVILRLAYEVLGNNGLFDNDRVMGVDLGKVKPFSSVINFGDGSYSTELAPSKELERLSEKSEILSREINFHHKKLREIESLLQGKNSLYLAQHYVDVEDNMRAVKNKRTRLKEAATWLYARDIVNHAVENNCHIVNLENLSFVENKGGKWNFSSIQEKVVFVAELCNIEVRLSNASGTSHTDPFTRETTRPNSQRIIKTVCGEIDRDYCAALEITQREGAVSKQQRKKNKKKKVVQKPLVPKRCRDKHCSTPKRPKSPSRKKIHKIQVKTSTPKYVFPGERMSGYPIAVDSSDAASLIEGTAFILTTRTLFISYYAKQIRFC